MGILWFALQVYILRSMREHETNVSQYIQQRRGKNPYVAFFSSRVHRLQQWSLCLLSLLCVLSVHISVVKAEEARLEKCAPHYEKIIEVQERRQKFQDGINLLIEMHEDGELDKKMLDSTLPLWHTIESRLRQEVTALYDKAYAEGCFDESLRIERRNAP